MDEKLYKLANHLEKTYLFKDLTPAKVGQELIMKAGTIRRLKLDESDENKKKLLEGIAELIEIAANKLFKL